MIDPLTIAAIRRVSRELGSSEDDPLRLLGGLVALVVEAWEKDAQDHNVALGQMLVLTESLAESLNRINGRLTALEGRLTDERGAGVGAGGAHGPPAGL